MAATSRATRSSSGPVLPVSSHFQRSISPSGRFSGGGGSASASAFASSSSSSFSSRSTSFFQRSASPTRVNLGHVSPSRSVRFSIDHHRASSPRRSIASKKPTISAGATGASARRTCMCSPTTHPGSFRCSLHKGFQIHNHNHHHHGAVSSSSNRLNARRSAMTNSLVRIGTVEGDWVKRALAALIRPSSHQQRRRASFQPRPSRLSAMSKA